MLYSWQTKHWQTLVEQADTLPHALLITGEAGIGKLAFARHLAQALLCEVAETALRPCAQCDACRWLLAGNHPDFRELTPSVEEGDDADDARTRKKAATHISIDQVRALGDFVNLSAHRGGRRVTLVHPAETLNAASANALLKTLEEPASGATFILVSHQWRRLLPTIRSRCRRFPLPLPDTAEALAWLESTGLPHAQEHLAFAGGAPLAAQERADDAQLTLRQGLLEQLAESRRLDPLAVAEQLDRQKLEAWRVIDWISRWVYDLARFRASGSIRYHPGDEARIAELAHRIEPTRLMRYHDMVLDAKRLAFHPLNNRLVFEQLLFGYQQLVREPGRTRNAN